MTNLGISKSIQLKDGRTISIETGKLAKQADGSVVVRMGDTMILATVVASLEPKENVNFLPLSVDYKEKYASTGKFPGGFFKREARPSEYEILISRLVDRALRPLFPEDYHSETQMLITLLSAEKDASPDALAALAASAALSVSDIPFNGPISEARVIKLDDEFIINPSISQIENAELDLIVAASMENILMVEGAMKEVSEAVMLEAIKVAHEAIKDQCQLQLDLADMVEKSKIKREYCHEAKDEDLKKQVFSATYDKAFKIASSGNTNKHERSDAFEAIKTEFKETFSEEELEEKESMINRYYHDVEKEAVRNCILEQRIRLDGRKLDEIRPIWSEIDYLPSAHGSAVFTRGETQSIVTVTLGSKMDQQMIDGAVFEGTSNFLLHYNFPPFCTGEARPMRGTSRREIGHGNLAWRAIKQVLPGVPENPYTIRIVSDILESNGSSSMATVCGGTLALMDAGVKISKPVSGIAMGLITEPGNKKYAVLSDILGDEDHLGDMDFKVTGTVDGITACQMDIKVDGLPYQILEEALEQARKGRLHILGEMAKTITEPNEDYKPHVPRIEKITIDKEFIGAIIGPGGKVIQEMQRETGTTISIEEEGEFGIIDIVSNDKASIEAAKEIIKNITAVPEIGKVYQGKVKKIVDFGAFVEFLPGKEALLHISEITWSHLKDVSSVLKEGEEIEVKLIGKDQRTGKLKLSRKVLIPRDNQ